MSSKHIHVKRRALAAMYYASGETLEQVGKRLGINKARVWQIIHSRPDVLDVCRRNKLARKERRNLRDEHRKAKALVQAKQEVAVRSQEMAVEAQREADEAERKLEQIQDNAPEASSIQPQN